GPKPPPEKPEAEASLIGAILIDARVYEETVRGRIAPAELSREPHRLILGAIERVWERGEPLGFQTVQAELAARGELDNIGGAQFLVGLMQNVPTVAHAETYATIVERTALLRRLIGAANEIAHLALTREDAKSAVVDAQELLFAVSESNLHRDVVPLEIALRRFADQITQRADDQHVGVPTGFTALDAKTGGLQPSDLLVVDYLQLIEGAGDDEGRVQEVARISRALKAIARELQVPVLALSQLSRQIETRGTEPMLSDLRESGALEADADLVMFLWQKDRKDRDENVVRLKLAKHRNGPTGD